LEGAVSEASEIKVLVSVDAIQDAEAKMRRALAKQ
jgi:hypothetical protein